MRLLGTLFIFTIPAWILVAGSILFMHAGVVLGDANAAPGTSRSLGFYGITAAIIWCLAAVCIRRSPVGTAYGIGSATALLAVSLVEGDTYLNWLPIGAVCIAGAIRYIPFVDGTPIDRDLIASLGPEDLDPGVPEDGHR
jgi:hypothetical protein